MCGVVAPAEAGDPNVMDASVTRPGEPWCCCCWWGWGWLESPQDRRRWDEDAEDDGQDTDDVRVSGVAAVHGMASGAQGVATLTARQAGAGC